MTWKSMWAHGRWCQTYIEKLEAVKRTDLLDTNRAALHVYISVNEGLITPEELMAQHQHFILPHQQKGL